MKNKPSIDFDALYQHGADIAESVFEQEPSQVALAFAIGLIIAEVIHQIGEKSESSQQAAEQNAVFNDIMRMAVEARLETYAAMRDAEPSVEIFVMLEPRNV